MQYAEVVVRYDELSTKGKSRRDSIGRLAGNVTRALQNFPEIEMHPRHDRMHIVLDGAPFDKVNQRLKLAFGIQTYSPTIKVGKDLDAIKKASLESMQATFKDGMTFKVSTRRSDHEFKYDANQLNTMIGNYLFDNMDNLKVKMKKPDLVLRIEVRQDAVYISNQLLHGADGMSVGATSWAVMMLSGGIDPPVVFYLAMRRGVEIDMVHFFSPPYITGKALAKVRELTGILANYSGKINFITVPFTEIQEQIKGELPGGYLMTIQCYFILQLANHIHAIREGLTIFNGESVGQVAPQVLESVVAINDVTSTLALRPVAAMDKTEIIKLAEQIDTSDLSIEPFEDCYTTFVPPRPKTKPKLDEARKLENGLDTEGMIQHTVDGTEITPIYPNQKFLDNKAQEDANLL